MWEDPANKKGGYFNIKLQKNKGDKVWENLVLLTVAPLKDNG